MPQIMVITPMYSGESGLANEYWERLKTLGNPTKTKFQRARFLLFLTKLYQQSLRLLRLHFSVAFQLPLPV